MGHVYPLWPFRYSFGLMPLRREKNLLKDYLKDEEEDLYWSQGAVELIEKIGTQNWLLLQL